MPHFDKPRFVMQNDPRQSAYGMMIAVSAFWLDKGDFGYDELFDTVKDETNSYKGKMVDGGAVDKEDYDKWYNSLPDKIVQKPLCSYAIYPPHTINEEEILWCFQWALDEMYRLYCNRKTLKDINIPFVKTSANKSLCEAKVTSLKNADYTKVKNIELYKVK